jgi:hypothetical protein
LIVDEIGYLTYGTDAANMLFHVVNDRHRRRRAMIFTTNNPPLLGAACSTTTTSLKPSSIAFLSAGAYLLSTAPRSEPVTSVRTTQTLPHHLLRWPEFPEIRRPDFPEPTSGIRAGRDHDRLR